MRDGELGWGVGLVEVAAVPAGQAVQAGEIVKQDLAFPEGHQTTLTQLAQDTVHMDGSKAQRISQKILVQTGRHNSHRCRARRVADARELEQKVCGAFEGTAPADADQVLDHHRLIARGGPQDRGTQPRQLPEAVHHLPGRHLRDDDIGEGGERVIGGDCN